MKFKIRIRIQIKIKIWVKIKIRMRTNLPTASVRKRETTPPRSSVTPHIIAAVFSSTSSADGDDNVDGEVDATNGVADGDGGDDHIGD